MPTVPEAQVGESGATGAVAAWCDTCRDFVWVDDEWRCERGHPRTVLSRWYVPDTGEHVTPPWREQLVHPEGEGAEQPADDVQQPEDAEARPVPQAESSAGDLAVASRLDLLATMMQSLSDTKYYVVEYGHDTDLVVTSVCSPELEAQGMQHTEYSAILKAVEATATVFMWESLKESSGGIAFGGVESELHDEEELRSSAEAGGALLPDHEEDARGSQQPGWDYRRTQDLLSRIAEESGWRLDTVFRREGATW
jgi:hypothetical protein